MNADQWLNQAELILEAYRPAASDTYVLFAANHKIGLNQKRIVPAGRPIIATFSSRDINKGPTPSMWDQIAARIRQLKKEKIL